MVLVAIGLMIATFVGARVLERSRELALLKAAGFTPLQLLLLPLVENTALALAGTGVGIALGTVATPRVAGQTAALTGSIPVAVDVGTIAVVALVVLGSVAVATLIPARQAGRVATIAAIADRARVARRPSLARGLALGLGVRQALARPGRTCAIVVALALGVGALTASSAMDETLRQQTQIASASHGELPPIASSGLGPTDPDPVASASAGNQQIRATVWNLNVMLLLLIIANVLATTILGVRERTRENGILRALGMTPSQAIAAVSGPLVASAAAAVVVGVPFGIGLFGAVYRIAGGSTDPVPPTALALVALVVAPVVAVALVSLVPATAARRIDVTAALRRE